MGLLRQAGKKKGRKSMTVLLGDISGLTEEELLEAVRGVSEITVRVETVKAKVSCLSCGFSGEPKVLERLHGHVLICCPKCGGRKLKVLAGNEIKLK